MNLEFATSDVFLRLSDGETNHQQASDNRQDCEKHNIKEVSNIRAKRRPEGNRRSVCPHREI